MSANDERTNIITDKNVIKTLPKSSFKVRYIGMLVYFLIFSEDCIFQIYAIITILHSFGIYVNLLLCISIILGIKIIIAYFFNYYIYLLILSFLEVVKDEPEIIKLYKLIINKN